MSPVRLRSPETNCRSMLRVMFVSGADTSVVLRVV
jgi:hypothetical protein